MGMDAEIIVFGERDMTAADVATLRNALPPDEDNFPFIELATPDNLFGSKYVPPTNLWVGEDQGGYITIGHVGVVIVPGCRFYSEKCDYRRSWPTLNSYFEKIAAALPGFRMSCQPDYAGCAGYEVTPEKVAQLDAVWDKSLTTS